ncbi:MAG: hypothetical protein ACXV3C_02920 [Actinomycetes bacterium]
MLALATLVVAGAAGLLGCLRAAPASAATDCVAVLVDFRKLGGNLQTGCAQGDPSNGFQALTRAGFAYTPRPRDGLVCQINAKPACTDTTTSAYWSYWYRAPGSSTWVYANQGPGTHDPRPGSTEAWVWQDGGRAQPPSVAASSICPQLKASRSPTPTPTRSSPRTTRGSSAGASRTAHPGQATASKAARAPSLAPSATPGPTSPSPSPSRTSKVVTATSDPSSAESTTAPPSTTGAAPTGGSGSRLPAGAGLAAGAVLVVGIGAAAMARARRNGSS